MIKNRLKFPYEYVWIDESGGIHICHFLTCENGCNCENGSSSLACIEDMVKKLKKRKDIPF